MTRATPAPAWLEDVLRDAPPILTITEACALTRMSPRTLRRYAAAGRVRTLRAGDGACRLLFPRAAVGELLRGMAD